MRLAWKLSTRASSTRAGSKLAWKLRTNPKANPWLTWKLEESIH